MNHLPVIHHYGRDTLFLVKSVPSSSPVTPLRLWCHSDTEVEWKVLRSLYSGYVHIFPCVSVCVSMCMHVCACLCLCMQIGLLVCSIGKYNDRLLYNWYNSFSFTCCLNYLWLDDSGGTLCYLRDGQSNCICIYSILVMHSVHIWNTCV